MIQISVWNGFYTLAQLIILDTFHFNMTNGACVVGPNGNYGLSSISTLFKGDKTM
jgi:hypothetical protein